VNITKPASFKGSNWPSCSFFGIYDGHGGSSCAEFLKDNLHLLITGDSNFPSNPVDAIRKGCEKAEYFFTTKIAVKNGEVVDKSGSCAIFCIIIGKFN
jgi:protein phosphatase 2C family protein 2/3